MHARTHACMHACIEGGTGTVSGGGAAAAAVLATCITHVPSDLPSYQY